jgi:hypothetical protein
VVPSRAFEVPLYCRRDDSPFLPPEAQAGLPCGGSTPTSDQRIDPLAVALRIAAGLGPPDLRIGMNPRKGMVNVPTWFWVEGYDGRTLSQSQPVHEEHQRCQLAPVRDADGRPTLDDTGRPTTQSECHTESTDFTVSVRLWPSRFAWDFGDQHGREIACLGRGECGQALGQPFVDALHPSPIAHQYVWSSLGANGTADAYTVGLRITFAADYQVELNGSSSGWQALPSRELEWTASHQVQEAQAVLTRP